MISYINEHNILQKQHIQQLHFNYIARYVSFLSSQCFWQLGYVLKIKYESHSLVFLLGDGTYRLDFKY